MLNAPVTDGWQEQDNALVRVFEFGSFADAIAFVRRVADAAEAANHHPDIDIRYTKVTFTLSTHDAGGITENDLSLARTIETLPHD